MYARRDAAVSRSAATGAGVERDQVQRVLLCDACGVLEPRSLTAGVRRIALQEQSPPRADRRAGCRASSPVAVAAFRPARPAPRSVIHGCPPQGPAQPMDAQTDVLIFGASPPR